MTKPKLNYEKSPFSHILGHQDMVKYLVQKEDEWRHRNDPHPPIPKESKFMKRFNRAFSFGKVSRRAFMDSISKYQIM